MSLTDIMSNLGLAVYPQVALLIFAIVFVAILVRTLSRSRNFDRAALLPLDDDSNPPKGNTP